MQIAIQPIQLAKREERPVVQRPRVGMNVRQAQVSSDQSNSSIIATRFDSKLLEPTHSFIASCFAFLLECRQGFKSWKRWEMRARYEKYNSIQGILMRSSRIQTSPSYFKLLCRRWTRTLCLNMKHYVLSSKKTGLHDYLDCLFQNSSRLHFCFEWYKWYYR